MFPAILGVVALTLGATYCYFRFRPPQGDLKPLPRENLQHILKQEGRQGDVD